MATTRITRRVDPCDCGCQGKDPWHAKTFDRVITDIRDERGRATSYEGVGLDYDKVGTVSAPWSDEPVVVVRQIFEWDNKKTSVIGWTFAKYLTP